MTIPKQVKTMEEFKKAVIIKGKVTYDIETLFSRWQQRSMEVADVFQFELSPDPLALIDEYGCLRKGNKALYWSSVLVSLLRHHLLQTWC